MYLILGGDKIFCLNCKKPLTKIQITKKNKFCCKGCATSYRQKANDPNFLEIDNQTKYYILGFIYSDGNLDKDKKKISIRTSDYDLALILFNIMCDKTKRILYKQEYENENHKDSYLILNTNKKAIDELELFGITPCKSYTMQFPKIPNEFLKDFIRGYFDGDGCVYISSKHKEKKYYSISFTCGNIEFLKDLKIVLKNLNMDSCINSDCRENNNSFYLKINKQKDVKLFFKIIYENSQIHLQRKYNIFMNDIV